MQVIRHWDIASGSERQLRLERRTYLFSTLLTFVCGTQLLAAAAVRLQRRQDVGDVRRRDVRGGHAQRQCLRLPRADTRRLVCSSSPPLWLAINHVDSRARDYPLVKLKYALLLAGIPLFALSLGLQLNYFLGLKADVITSCCGSLFSTDAHDAGQ